MNKQKIINAFEKHSPRTPMSEEETKLFLMFLLSKDETISEDIDNVNKESETYKQLKPIITCFQAKVFLGRLKSLTSLRISLGALIILLYHFPNPAHCVMYAFYLHQKLPTNTIIDLKVISTELFPWGFFSNEQLNEIWDEQKVKVDKESKQYTCCGAPDNLLDYVESWEK